MRVENIIIKSSIQKFFPFSGIYEIKLIHDCEPGDTASIEYPIEPAGLEPTVASANGEERANGLLPGRRAPAF
jgi:hypothetical protein